MTGPSKAAATPPTAPYPSFVALLRVFQQHGAPAVVDHGALRKGFPPNAVQTLLDALRFLELINAKGEPTPRLAAMVEAIDSPAWPETLGAVLREAYGDVLAEGLENATPAQLNQRLKASFGLQAEACRRSATFLLAAAHEAGIPVSPYLVAPPRSKGRLLPHRNGEAQADDNADVAPGEALAAKLIEKFPEFDPKWPDALKAHWFAQFNELIQLVKPDERPPQP